MKRSLLCVIAAFVLLSAPLARAKGAAPPRFQQVVEISVKPGQELVFENYIKKLVAAADKAGAKMTWTTYVVSLGKPGATYRVALSFNSWADRDGWTSIPAMMTKAFGQPEAKRLMKEGGSASTQSVSEVWENLPNLSANAGSASGATPPNFVCAAPCPVQPSTTSPRHRDPIRTPSSSSASSPERRQTLSGCRSVAPSSQSR